MHAVSRIKVARNMDYHQQLADHYTEQAANGGDGAGTRTTAETTTDQYLADLHADVAQQLREVLQGGTPPVILDMMSPVVRESGVVEAAPTPTSAAAARRRRAN